MTARAQMMNMAELVPETEIPLVIEILKRFIYYDDDIATPDDVISHKLAVKEYDEGQTISHENIKWE